MNKFKKSDLITMFKAKINSSLLKSHFYPSNEQIKNNFCRTNRTLINQYKCEMYSNFYTLIGKTVRSRLIHFI